jgi:Leucine-rich repeat (LRR) protein
MTDTSVRAHRPALRIRRFVTLTALLACSAATPCALARDDDADKVIAEIQKLGGKVDRDETAKDKPVVTVNFSTTQVGDDALANLKGLPQLRKVTLNGTKVTDAGLERLKGLTGLEKIYLVDTKVTDAGLEHLKDLSNLKVLSLVGTQVTDAGLEHLKSLSNLKELYVYGTKVTEEGGKKLQEALPKVKIDR